MNSLANLLPFLLVLLFLFFIFSRMRNQQRQVRETQQAVRPGAQVMTTAGLFARVVSLEDDVVLLEIAPGVTCRYARAAVARIVGPAVGSAETTGDEDGSTAAS